MLPWNIGRWLEDRRTACADWLHCGQTQPKARFYAPAVPFRTMRVASKRDVWVILSTSCLRCHWSGTAGRRRARVGERVNAASRAEDMLQRVRAIWVQAGLPAGDGCERDADDAALSRALVGRIYALLFIASGCVTVLSPFLPSIPTMDRIGVIAIGLVAIGSGCAVLLVPWQRLPRSATLWMVPPAFVLIACHNYFGGSDPYRFSIFFMVAFIAVGIAHPQGTSVRLSPLFALAYVAPLLLRQPISWVGVSSVGYTGAVCLLAGETLAWFSGRLRLAQRALGASEARYRSLAQNASDIVLVVDAGACLRYASPSAAATGVRPEDLCGQSLLAWVHPDDRSQVTGLLEASLAAPGASATAEWRYRHASGRWRYVEAIASNLMAEPSVEGVVITARDIEERKTLAAQLAHQAFHDPLTGLANRALLLERLEHNLRRLRSHPGVLAILVLDLDDFKLVNDSLGHEHGDELLLAVAQRLRDAVDPADSIARWSGDEFVILAEGRPSLDEAIDLADAVLNALERPVVVRGRELFASVSIGVAVHHAHDDKTADVLLREADVAVHRAKARGKHRSVVYDLSMDARAAERLELTLDLRRALDRSEFVPYYQPMVALATGEVALREAL
ncbi:MAG TPA: diguanylate cyclase, partial [Candidatus Limnocylindria bacterium]|nr:diguanylate cyclase [Candidatus Limnocylindria bacterium]